MAWGKKKAEKPELSAEERSLLVALSRLGASDDGKALLDLLERVIEIDAHQTEQAILAGNDRLAAIISGRRQRAREIVDRVKSAHDKLWKEE